MSGGDGPAGDSVGKRGRTWLASNGWDEPARDGVRTWQPSVSRDARRAAGSPPAGTAAAPSEQHGLAGKGGGMAGAGGAEPAPEEPGAAVVNAALEMPTARARASSAGGSVWLKTEGATAAGGSGVTQGATAGDRADQVGGRPAPPVGRAAGGTRTAARLELPIARPGCPRAGATAARPPEVGTTAGREAGGAEGGGTGPPAPPPAIAGEL